MQMCVYVDTYISILINFKFFSNILQKVYFFISFLEIYIKLAFNFEKLFMQSFMINISMRIPKKKRILINFLIQNFSCLCSLFENFN